MTGCEPNATNDGCPPAIFNEFCPGARVTFKEIDVRKQALRAVAASAVAVAGVTAAGPLAEGASASTDPSPGAWAALRMCESSGNYAADTGNGYYGAYQFDLSTWDSLGLGGLPSNASPGLQDQAAQELFAQRGAEPWPVCGAYLSGSSSSAPAPAAASVSAPAAATSASAPSTGDGDGDSDDGVATPAAAPAAASGWSSYTVQPGDTLWWLAIDHGTTVSALASVNHIANPNLILVGQVIEV